MVFSEGPDKGYAWVIAIAAGCITMILSGISKMIGILYVAVIDTYHVSRQQATLPFTFRKSLRCLSGPLAGVLGQRFGIRAVTISGGLIAASGAGLSFFAPNITWLAVCWGGIHGFGEALANTLFQVVVNQYFVKYRATASGIAMSGACFGSVMFSFLIEALREAYGLQGTFLILSALILHVLPAAILLRSPSWIRNGTDPPSELTTLNEEIKREPTLYMTAGDYMNGDTRKRTSITSLSPRLLMDRMNGSAHPNGMSDPKVKLVQYLERRLDCEKGIDNPGFLKDCDLEKPPQQKAQLVKKRSLQDVYATTKENRYSILSGNLSRRSSVQPSSPKPDTNHIKTVQEEEDPPQTLLHSIKNIVRVHRNPVFLLISLCMCTYVVTFIPVMTSMVDYGKDKGLPESVGKYLIHANAVGDLIGRLCLGWVTDKEYLTIPRYMTLVLILQGTFIILIPHVYKLGPYLVLLALYSMCTGSMLVRLPVLVLNHVKEEQQPVAIGSYGFASGLVPFGVPMLIGHFRDHIGSYDGMYHLLGCISITSGALWTLEPFLARLNNRLEARRTMNVSV